MNRFTFTVFGLLLAVLLWQPAIAGTFTFTTLDDPSTTLGTYLSNISGNTVVGAYVSPASNAPVGFIYNGSTYTTLIDPVGARGTSVSGISGNNIVGSYWDAFDNVHGFIYNGSSYTTIDDPLGVDGTYACGISGNNIVGCYLNPPSQNHGFLYNGSSYTTIDDPLGVDGTYAYGISGHNIVGCYLNPSSQNHGFLYNGSTYTTIDDPLAGPAGSYAIGISGNNIVGTYLDSSNQEHGFLYNGSTYTTLDDPLAGSGAGYGTWACGISGNNIVGYYTDSSGIYHGYIATIVPEPSTLALLGVGAMGLIAYVWRRRRARTIVRLLLATALLASVVAARADVFHMPSGETSIKMVPVGNPGNAPDTTVMVTDSTAGYGSVAYNYSIDKYDVTLAQYTQFLNAVAQTDTYGLYNSNMSTSYNTQGIQQTGSPGSYSYSVTGSNPQAANCPVYNVSWFDAARFCNWLQNGQPTSGTEGAGTTETGAYTLNGDTTSGLETKNAGATYWIPSENEWYKAAYYSPLLNSGSGGYYTYATQSNIAPSNSLVLVPNDANYDNGAFTDSTNYLTPVGYFSTSPSYYGTFDQSGDVWNWNDAIISGSYRGLRGGSWLDRSFTLASSYRIEYYPTREYDIVGFRVASVPEPGSITLLLACAVAFGIWRQRRKA